MILLDTNVISELVRRDPNLLVVEWIDRQPPEQLHLATPVMAELLFGLMLLPDGKRQRALASAVIVVLDTFFAGRILAFDAPAARRYASIMARERRAGQSLPILDLQIAAIAAANNASVATRDTAPFIAAGIPTINPWQA